MTTNSLAHNEWKIHRHNEIVEDLHEYITKMSALTEIVLSADFTQYKPKIMHDYWWSLSDLLRAAKMLCEELEE